MIPKRRRLVTMAALVAIVAGTSTMISPAAIGQTDALGGYTVSSRANAFMIRYDSPGSLPISPLLETTVPEAQTSLVTGPIGSASSALGYPGPVVLGLEALLEQSGAAPPDLPDYPLIATAHTSGPNDVRDDATVPGGVMHAHAEGTEVRAATTVGAVGSDTVLAFGGVRSESSSTATETANSTAAVTVSDIRLLDGLITIGAIESELSATSDGSEASSAGGTKIVGLNVLGLPAVLDHEGLRFAKPPRDSPANGLGALVEALNPLTIALELIGDQLGSLGEILSEVGITISLAEPTEMLDGADVTRVTQGLTIEIAGNLSETPLAALFDLLPPIDTPEGLPLGPSDIIQLLQAPHIATISIGRAEVSASATPPFTLDLPAFDPDTPPTASPSGPALPSQPAGPSVGGTPTPSPGTAAPAPGPVSLSSSEPIDLPGPVGLGLIIAAIAGAWLLSLGTRRLPDWALDGVIAGDACVDPIDGGLRQPPPTEGNNR